MYCIFPFAQLTYNLYSNNEFGTFVGERRLRSSLHRAGTFEVYYNMRFHSQEQKSEGREKKVRKGEGEGEILLYMTIM